MIFTIRLLVTIALFALILWQIGGPSQLVAAVRGFDPLILLGVLGVNNADRLLMTYKWLRLLRTRGIQLPLLHGTQIYCASMVWGLFLPATMGADAVRATSTVRRGLDLHHVLSSIVVERALGFLATLVLGMLGLFLVSVKTELPQTLDIVWWLSAALLTLGAVALAVSFSDWAYELIYERLLRRHRDNRVVNQVRRLHENYQSYRIHRRSLALFFGLSLLEQLVPACAVWLIAIGLGIDLDPLYLVGAVPLAFLVARIPFSLGGIGVFEGALMLLLSLIGVSSVEAASIAITARILEISSWLPWWAAQTFTRGSLGRPDVKERVN
jgi:uncharacterized protein (TIRG00374 family)